MFRLFLHMLKGEGDEPLAPVSPGLIESGAKVLSLCQKREGQGVKAGMAALI